MDRKGKQKVRSILWSVLIIAVIIIAIGIVFYYEGKIRDEQMWELIVIYPEMETNLRDNFSYYQKQVIGLKMIMILVLVVLLFLWRFILVWNGKRKIKNNASRYDDELNLLYEQLVRFQKGNYEMISSFDEKGITDKWESVYEKLREFGCYFEDMRVHLAEEENSTKALITDISHQLKTPLASIRMCHELAKSSELTEDERKDFLQTEEREIKKMEVLLDELIKLSRLENHMIQIKMEKQSLKQTISEAVSQIYMKAYAKKMEICVEQENDVEILHDRKWTVEALANVLENAVKYSHPETVIDIRVSYLPSNVLIEIADEGVGIQEEELHEIFKRFYRGSKARQFVKEGAGVGLYLTRSIIEQQGGTIIAKRKAESGMIFKIMLPL